MKIFYSILLIITFIYTINAQNSESLSWKGVTIDKSTPEDTIAKFGKPAKDETDRLDIFYTKIGVFTQNIYKKEYRVLKYKEIDQAKNVQFGFNKDGKLVFISFLASAKKDLDVQAFLKSFENTNFKPKEEDAIFYTLFGKRQSGYILAKISRGFAELMKGRSVSDKPTEDVSNDNLAGTVVTVQFISKSLENNDNTDILK